MAKPKGTGRSSYDRIVEAMERTPGWARLTAEMARRLRAARLHEVRPGYERDRLSTGRLTARFEVSYGREPFEGENVSSVSEGYRYHVPEWAVVSKEDVERELMPYFGLKQCPTYFCKGETVLEKLWQKAKAAISADPALDALREEAEARVNAEMTEAVASGRAAAAAESWYEAEAVEAIKRAVLKYRGLRPEVYKLALDLVVVHEICGS